MLEFLISILLALGFSPVKSDNGMLKIDSKVVIEAKAYSDKYTSLGGDEALNQVAVLSSEPLTDVIVTDGVDPTAIK